MDAVRGYLLCVIGAALICAVVQQFLTEKSAHLPLVKMICGLIMVLSVLSPLVNLSDFAPFSWTHEFANQADTAVVSGQQISYDALSEVILKRLEAYILDEARTLGAELTVTIELADGTLPTPHAVIIQGDVSPFAKNKLQSIIESELGISKENQKWI